MRAAHPGLCAAAALVAGWLLTAPTDAQALPAYVTLYDVTFTDGGSASGEFSLNGSGYLTTPTLIITTAGSLLGGASYTLSGPALLTATTVDLTLPDPPAASAYKFGLHLVFADPLGSVTMDRLTSASCEFTDYACASPGTRFIASGFAMVPEPGSMATLGPALVGVGALRRRRSG